MTTSWRWPSSAPSAPKTQTSRFGRHVRFACLPLPVLQPWAAAPAPPHPPAPARPLLLPPGGRLHRGPQQCHLRHWLQRLPAGLPRFQGAAQPPRSRRPGVCSAAGKLAGQLVGLCCPYTRTQAHTNTQAPSNLAPTHKPASPPRHTPPHPAAALGQEVEAWRPAGHQVPVRVPRRDERHSEQEWGLGCGGGSRAAHAAACSQLLHHGWARGMRLLQMGVTDKQADDSGGAGGGAACHPAAYLPPCVRSGGRQGVCHHVPLQRVRQTHDSGWGAVGPMSVFDVCVVCCVCVSCSCAGKQVFRPPHAHTPPPPCAC